MSVRSPVRVRQTHTHTDRSCQNYYTRRVADAGCKKEKRINWNRQPRSKTSVVPTEQKISSTYKNNHKNSLIMTLPIIWRTLNSLHISISWNSKYLIPKGIRILLKKFLNKGSESKYPVSQILTILPIHHQLRQVITICLILPFNCMLINWHVLGTWLPQSWQSLQLKSWNYVQGFMSITFCLAIVCQLFCAAWQVIVKHLASKHQAHAKWVACNWKAAWSRWQSFDWVGGVGGTCINTTF